MWSSALLLFIQLIIFNNLFYSFTFCQSTLLLGCHSLSFFISFIFQAKSVLLLRSPFLFSSSCHLFCKFTSVFYSFFWYTLLFYLFTLNLFCQKLLIFLLSIFQFYLFVVVFLLNAHVHNFIVMKSFFDYHLLYIGIWRWLWWFKMMMISGLARPIDPADEGRRSLQAQRVSLSHCQHNRHAFWAKK